MVIQPNPKPFKRHLFAWSQLHDSIVMSQRHNMHSNICKTHTLFFAACGLSDNCHIGNLLPLRSHLRTCKLSTCSSIVGHCHVPLTAWIGPKLWHSGQDSLSIIYQYRISNLLEKLFSPTKRQASDFGSISKSICFFVKPSVSIRVPIYPSCAWKFRVWCFFFLARLFSIRCWSESA